MSTYTDRETVTAWLNGLDAAREAAAPGPWQARSLGEIVRPCRCGLEGCTVPVGLMDDEDGDTTRDDAAAFVIAAAVNALPKLTAALRAVQALADELDTNAAEAHAAMRAMYLAERPAAAEAHAYKSNAYSSAADRIRAAVAAVLAVARHHQEGTGA